MSLADLTAEALEQATAALPSGGERRDGQVEMARAVAAAIADEGHAVIQAGTGTGKSLAYLVPTVLSDKPAVIATATKALQDQLAGKDLPFLADQLDVPFGFAVLKGRSNYLCLQRLDELEADDRLDLDLEDGDDDRTSIDSETLVELRSFAAESETGDRAELESVSDRVWRLSGRSRCPRCRPPRRRSGRSPRGGQAVWSSTCLRTGDHGRNDPARTRSGRHRRGPSTRRHCGRGCRPDQSRVQAAAGASVLVETDASQRAEDAAVALHVSLEPLIGDRLLDGPDEQVGRALDDVRGAAERLLEALRAVPDSAPADTKAKAIRARQVATGLVDDIDAVRWPTDDEVMWVDGPPSNPGLRSTPIAVGDLLAEQLWDRRTGVLTSATLPANATSQLGLPNTTVDLDVGSPFDYESNALLYCPTHLPDPRTDGFRSAQHTEIEALMAAAGGRTLALFTSFSAMREAAERLDGRLPWPILMQGDGAKNALLRQFIEDKPTSLFATMSFWQGVDAPGSTCRLVIIDRLPFPRPNDPVLQARRDRAGKAAFREIDLPRAATLLAQGAGRLIRTSTDQGVVAVLDPRLATSRSYRWDLVKALPPMRRTRERDDATRYLQDLRDG